MEACVHSLLAVHPVLKLGTCAEGSITHRWTWWKVHFSQIEPPTTMEIPESDCVYHVVLRMPEYPFEKNYGHSKFRPRTEQEVARVTALSNCGPFTRIKEEPTVRTAFTPATTSKFRDGYQFHGCSQSNVISSGI